MAKIIAQDGATLSVNGIGLPIPKGTTINIRSGNDQNRVITGHEQNGDGSQTPIYSIVSAMLEGIIVSVTDTAIEDSFNGFFAVDDHQVVLSNGGTDYSISKAILVSPSEDGTPGIESNTRKSEAFNIVSQLGKIQRS